MVLQMRRAAKVDKTLSGGPGPVTRKAIRTSAGTGVRLAMPSVTLSDVMNVPLNSFDHHSFWLYSLPGVGKTSLAAAFPDMHLFCFEPGADYVAVHQKPVTHWLEWVAYVDAFTATKKFKWAAVDIMEDAFDMCFNFMCEEVLKIDHPNDEKDFGKSWGAIYTEYFTQMYRLARSGKGTIFISHAAERLFKPAFGESYEVVRPALSSKPLDRLAGKVTVLGYLYRDSQLKQNVLRIRQTESYLAKCRPTNLFLYPDGSPVELIHMGNTPAEGYAAYKAAFENKLKKPTVQATVRKSLPALKVK